MDMFRHAANCTTGSILDRLMAAQTWARYADDAHHPSALEAYQSAIQLLHLVVMLASDANSRYRLLADRRLRSGVLSSDAAACTIRFDQVECAVEMLEEGRSIFWSQALQLRTSLDDLHHAFPEFAKRLKKIFTDLERSSFREGSFASLATCTDVKAVMTTEAEAAQYRRLNEDRLATLQEVRALKGFEGFLHWKRLATLKMAAVHGPVILLNATLSSCDALIVTSTSVERVPLSLQLSDQQVILLANSLLTAVSSFSSFTNKYKGSFETLLEHTQTSRGFLHDRKAGHHQKVSLQNVDDILRGVLAVLWKLVVRPVIHHLKLEVRSFPVLVLRAHRATQKSESPPRVWWCPTGPFSTLPFHAAGIYAPETKMGAVENVSDYMVSSYTPTLNSLLMPSPVSSAAPFKMLVAIQPEIEGHVTLTQTREEMRQIERHVPASSLIKLGVSGSPPSKVETVLSHLSHASIAHFACHGVQDPSNPLESALLLDGRLKVSTIMTQSLPTASLAFLSACETAKGTIQLLDEAMHLAGTMLFSGFRSVVATKW